MNFDDVPQYNEFAKILTSAQVTFPPSQIHGMICGYICAGSEMDGKSWVELILGHAKARDEELKECKAMLLQLYKIYSCKLQGIEFDFELLLPDEDETDIGMRAEALSDWCQGFIIALERSGINVASNISVDATEALQHMTEISTLDYDGIEVSEEDERSYTEVSEYVRIAVLMIYTEVSSQQGTQGNLGSATSSKLH